MTGVAVAETIEAWDHDWGVAQPHPHQHVAYQCKHVHSCLAQSIDSFGAVGGIRAHDHFIQVIRVYDGGKLQSKDVRKQHCYAVHA